MSGPTVQPGSPSAPAPDLRSFVPRGSLRWLRDEPDVRHRRVDASLVFVDISGFTAMSERLARLGRLGAEEVTDLLNQTFGQLLDVAYENDGSLLKFGGDALLLQFDGPDHPARATHAAWGMRRRLRQLQPLQSSAGQVRLRMSAGVHSGKLDQFLVGHRHRELLLVGPGVSTVARMEAAAGAGEILLSRGTVRRLGAGARYTAAGPGFRLRGEPASPRIVPSPGEKDHPSDFAARLLSTSVRTRLAAGGTTSEHRLAVIGFVRFGDTDRLLAQEGPEAAAQALESLIDLVDDAVAADDVCLLASDIDADGGKLILTAGVPTATEFDGERMLRALRQVADAEPSLPLRMGVHAGPVYAGVVGPWFRLTYTIIGDAVNLAARVMGRADPGALLATPEVLNRSQALFAVEELPPFRVKGKKQPVRALRVGSAIGQRARRPQSRYPLAGRRTELSTLMDEIDTASARPGRLVQLVGPAGLGKSRLVDELQERRPDVPFLIVGCSRYGSSVPYDAIGRFVLELLDLTPTSTPDELATAVRTVDPELVAALPLIGDLIGIPVPNTEATRDLTPSFRTARAQVVTGELLEACLPDPAVLVVEDAHWLDPDSIHLLVAMTGNVLGRRGWLMLLTARSPVLLDPHLAVSEVVVKLEPLGGKEARELVFAAVEDGSVTLEQGQQLLERAGGNPFFLQQLLRTGVGDGDLPDDVEAIIQAELDTLSPEDRELLGHAAVLGDEVDPDLFEALSGLGRTEQETLWGRLADYLEPSGSGTVRFRHALVHEASYTSLPFRRRRDLHQQAANVLVSQGSDRWDLLARHTYHARDWARAREYSVAAAAVAEDRYANLTAAEHYRHALESGRHVRDLAADEIADVWERLGDVLMLASSYDDAADAYRRAKRLASPVRQARLCGRIGQIRERQGRYPEALTWLTRGRRLDSAASTGETPRLLVESAIVRIRQGRARDALRIVQHVRQTDDVQVAARRSYVRAWAAMELGQDGREHEQRTLRLFRDAGDLIGQGLAYNVISMAAYYRGDWNEAADAYERARALRLQIGDEVAAAVASGNLGELLSDQGHLEHARSLLEEARSVCAAAGYASGHQFAIMTLGRLAAREGRYDDAARQLTAARDELAALKAGNLVRDVHVRIAELAVFRGDHDAALAEAAWLDQAQDDRGAGLRAAGQRIRTGVQLVRRDLTAARREARVLLDRLATDATDFETLLSLFTVAMAFERSCDPDGPTIRSRAEKLRTRLGVIVPGEQLVLGPTAYFTLK